MKKFTIVLLILLLTPALFASASPLRLVNTFHRKIKGKLIAGQYSPDGTKVALSTIWKEGNNVDGLLMVLRNDGALLWEKDGIYTMLNWSRKGYLAALRTNTNHDHFWLEIFTGDGKHTLSYDLGGNLRVNILSWSPDGELLCVEEVTNNVPLRYLLFSPDKHLWDTGSYFGRSARWSPVSHTLLVHVTFSTQGTLKQKVFILCDNMREELDGMYPVWSIDGKTFGVSNEPKADSTVIYDLNGNKVVEYRGASTKYIHGLPSRTDIAFLLTDEGTGKVSMLSASGNELWSWEEEFENIFEFWSPDSKVLAVVKVKDGNLALRFYTAEGDVLAEKKISASGFGRRMRQEDVVWGDRNELMIKVNYRVSSGDIQRRIWLFDNTGRELFTTTHSWASLKKYGQGVLIYGVSVDRKDSEVIYVSWNGNSVKLGNTVVPSVSKWASDDPSLLVYSWHPKVTRDPNFGTIYESSSVWGYRVEGGLTTTTLPISQPVTFTSVKKPEPVLSPLKSMAEKVLKFARENPLLILLILVMIILLAYRARR